MGDGLPCSLKGMGIVLPTKARKALIPSEPGLWYKFRLLPHNELQQPAERLLFSAEARKATLGWVDWRVPRSTTWPSHLGFRQVWCESHVLEAARNSVFTLDTATLLWTKPL